MVTLDELTVPAPPPSVADWNDDGVVLLEGWLDDAVIDAYCEEWLAAHGPRLPERDGGDWTMAQWGGWRYEAPYLHNRALRDVVCDQALTVVVSSLIGETAAVNLNLTGWVSTERDWHQDSYLNTPEVGDAYAAVWVALDDIDPDSGPFQYVPGSHRWPQVTMEAIGRHVDLADPRWPKHSEAVLSPLFEAEIARRGAEVVTHVPRRGDVLVWHGRLLHRGSRPRVPGMERRAVIAHYSGVDRRPAWPAAVRAEAGGWMFPFDRPEPA